MAKLLSHIASILRGSVGGITYSANQFAQIIAKAKISPVQPGTIFQGWIKSCFNQASTDWRSLGSAIRAAWNAWAQTVILSGPLGPYTVPGRDLFIGANGLYEYLALRGAIIISPHSAAPTVAGLLSQPILTPQPPAAGNTGFRVVCRNNSGENVIAYMQRSIGFEQSRERFKGPWDTNTLFTQTIIGPALTVTFNFYGLTAGKRYFFMSRLISNVEPLRFSTVTMGNYIASTVP